jgi:uncharacterized protein
VTQLGFLRLATNPSVFGKHAVTLPRAWEMYDAYLSDARVSFVEEPAGVEPILRGYTQQQSFSPKIWNDAYLSAFSQTAGYEMVTFDQSFQQYANLKFTILL